MAGPRQKKKARSSTAKVKTGVSGRTKAGKKKVNFLGNETIAKNWDHKLTLAQNYERLGLSVRLNAATGGTEQKKKRQDDSQQDALAIHHGGAKVNSLVPSEVQVERDPETGRIIRVIRPEGDPLSKRSNPLNDPLNDIMDTDEEEEDRIEEGQNTTQQNEIIAQLEAQAAQEALEIERKRKPRQQSTREEDWIAELVEKHGDNYTAMFRDRKLNTMQQSEGDIKRRVKKWRARHKG